ncbi:putative capsid protein [Cyanoramphus nest associated circular K DNA virus]|uniref:putative capsid protein n=1 Tax=Cyanoramphus nest associated circular K DNA virus TaxID=1282444 RepID=UPI0002AB21C1|nr:putative capsid protein [Cyanoramphus nest associated circular K DNA virus]AGC55148.1 putative capsid protein [Cyanoramphus nest associated circular K DNA virus]
MPRRTYGGRSVRRRGSVRRRRAPMRRRVHHPRIGRGFSQYVASVFKTEEVSAGIVVAGGTSFSAFAPVSIVSMASAAASPANAVGYAFQFRIYDISNPTSGVPSDPSFITYAQIYDQFFLTKATLVLRPPLGIRSFPQTVVTNAATGQIPVAQYLPSTSRHLSYIERDSSLALTQPLPANGDGTFANRARYGAKQHSAYGPIVRTFWPRYLGAAYNGADYTSSEYVIGNRWLTQNRSVAVGGYIVLLFAYNGYGSAGGGPSTGAQPIINYDVEVYWHVKFRYTVYG